MQNMKKLAGGLLALLLCAAMLAAPVSGWFAAPVTAAMEVPARNSAAPVAGEADAANLMAIGGTSRMEMSEKGTLGLAFRFSLDCSGVEIVEKDVNDDGVLEPHVGDYTNGTVNGNKLIAVGALMSNNPLVGGDAAAFVRGNASSSTGSKVIDIKATYLYDTYHKDYVEYDADGIVYAVRITNIPKDKHEATDIYVRAYYVYEKDGVQTTVYDDVYVADYAKTDDTTYTQPAAKFEKKFTNPNFMYRVGNEVNVNLSSLFKGENLDSASVKVTTMDNTGATGTYNNGAIDFNGTGVVKVSIAGDNYSAATTVLLEVVNAKNATGAASATANNVVLLNDAGFGALEVKNGYTLYGNGFTLTRDGDSLALDMGYGFLTLDNGTLDNVQVVCPNFDYPIMFQKNYKNNNNAYSETSNGKTHYGNIRSAVIASGNSRIVNSRISGGRAAVYATNGNIVIEGSRIELGAAANVHVNPSVAQMTFKDVTLVQRPTQANVYSDKTVMGFSVLATTTADGVAAPISIEGDFKQYAWAYEAYTEFVPTSGQSYVEDVLDKKDYLHAVTYEDGVTRDPSANMGIVFFPDEGSAEKPTIDDNQNNKIYETVSLTKYSTTVWIYTIKNTNSIEGLHMADLTPYEPFAQGNMLPTLEYSDTNDDRVMSAFYDANKGWVYKLSVNLDNGDYTFDTSKLAMKQSGTAMAYTWPTGTAATIPVVEGTVEYPLSTTINGEAHTVYFQLIGTATSKEPPQWSSDANGSALSASMNASWEAGLCVASSRGGTWSGAAPALQNVYVRYYSTEAKAYKVIHLADYTPTSTGTLNGTNTTWTYTGSDFTLTLTGGQVHSSNKVNAMPVSVSVEGKNKLFFVASASNGLVNSGNSARSVPVSYSFTDGMGNTLTGSHSWSVAEDQDNEYKYSDFCNGTLTKLESSGGGGGGCVTPDTLVTLADGSQVRVDSLTGDEMLLVWNMETGKYDIAPIVFVDSEEEAEYEIIHLYFSDGSDVKVVYEHGFFDLDLGEYVYIDADNYADYVGHRFVTEGDVAANQWNVVTLDDVVIEREVTTAWSPVTFGHLCYYTNGVLSMPGGISGLFNIFEVDTDTMTYDAEAMQKDIETYGLLTLEDFGGLITQDAFDAFNGAYLQIAIGKGNLTWEDIAYMAERYIPLM